ncbi:SRPBCC domain-containing protein [Brevibacillus choshinensis]|uniref:SRPBCC domain-containing protein n=1 Tax=Brevibacillus choshinensis TaxID=54911 RepID=UPI002E1D26FF|nr:SRPBCC domain-containing protein [Brevibacillus choshinensis]
MSRSYLRSADKRPAVLRNHGRGTNGLLHKRVLFSHALEGIVQAWRVANWEEGISSLVKFALIEEGNGIRLVFDQTGIPDGQKERLETGWHENYWKPIGSTRIR